MKITGYTPDLMNAIQELYYWQHSNTNSFYNQLFDLFQKADLNNRMLLAKAFPAEDMAYSLWCHSGNYGEDLFKQTLEGL